MSTIAKACQHINTGAIFAYTTRTAADQDVRVVWYDFSNKRVVSQVRDLRSKSFDAASYTAVTSVVRPSKPISVPLPLQALEPVGKRGKTSKDGRAPALTTKDGQINPALAADAGVKQALPTHLRDVNKHAALAQNEVTDEKVHLEQVPTVDDDTPNTPDTPDTPDDEEVYADDLGLDELDLE